MAERVFSVPPGVDFATQLVLGLIERLRGKPPEAMAQVTLYLNSQRMRRRVTEVFVQGAASFLPRMFVLSELAQHPILADLAPPSSGLRRQLDLARLIDGLLQAQPDLAPRTALFDLARSLGLLLDEMQDEGVAAETIAALDVSGHSEHWARTQAFLRIIAPLMATADGPARHRIASERLAAQWQAAPPQGPVVIAGSTGSRGPVALLMRAVKGLPQGMLVLPGYDTDQPCSVWAQMDDALTAEDHPQFRFRRLMDMLDLAPSDIRPWRDVRPWNPDRNRLISLSLRPAPVTDQWLVEGQHLPDLPETTREMTLIKAANPRQEALTLALVLRRAVSRGQKAALVTPDRNLARRVEAQLDRWGILPDDSAGMPLALSAPGRLLRHVARAFEAPLTADVLMTLLKHPLAGSGGERGLHLKLTRELELELRRKGPVFPTAEALLIWSNARPEPEAAPWGQALARVLDLIASPPAESLSAHFALHLATTEALARGTAAEGAGELWSKEPGVAARKLMDALAEECDHEGSLSRSDYRMLFDGLIAKEEVRSPVTGHPLVAFHGPREAREVVADLVILAGLNEGTWPAASDPDPWLNRKMRKDAALLLPERQIGLSAHDYQQAVAAPEVILSRALRDAEAETVPSRWLNRLCNLMAGLPDRRGPEALQAMERRGQVWLARCAELEQPGGTVVDALKPAVRPQPRPPVPARPKELSLTRIRSLIRDPYAIYAQYVLRLKPLDPLRAQPDPRDRGTALHLILERFVRERPQDEAMDEARNRLLRIGAEVLAAETPFPSARALWHARLERAADHFLRQDQKLGGRTLQIEKSGATKVEGTDFTLYGTPDRIDVLPDDRLHLIDYKTGTPPTKAQQTVFELQLHLAAAMAERGGFTPHPMEVAQISYIGLGASEKVEETPLTPDEINAVWARFVALIKAYEDPKTGYTARRAVFDLRYPGDYDHLARFGEWDMTQRAVAIAVGQDDPA
ncbi:double-strand break repair protein AddB [bacterium]|nr:double-strand break repair protein AddB [bacterium]